MSTISSVSNPEKTGKSGVAGWMKRHPLLSMYAIMFAIAWGLIAPAVLASLGVLSFQPPQALSLVVGWSPAIASAIVTAVIAGRAGLRELFGRFLIWRVGFQWYLVAFFLLAAVILGGIGLHVFSGGAVPPIPAAEVSPAQVVLVFIVTVLFGILVNTEEVAWRGFALPRLQARHPLLIACLLLAIPEISLHLPNFLDKDALFYRNVGVFWFSAFSVAAVIIYAWIFNATKGSLVIVTLLHASQNAWANLLSDNSLRPFQFTVALMWLLAIVIIARNTRLFLSRPRDT